ncbi:MAG: hypothetical protein JXQ89_08175 [Pelagimonas sp.]
MPKFKNEALRDSIVPTELLEVLGWPEAPSEIWQEPFDEVRGHCERIADTTKPTDLIEFCDFFLDYQYMTVQEDFLSFAFPKALEAWARHELGLPARERFNGEWDFEGMWDALACRPIHPEFFDAAQFNALAGFFVRVLLARLQQETVLSFRGGHPRSFEWMYLLATLIWQFPVAEHIWKQWWRLETPQMAICAVQWLSVFIYDHDDNPYFDPWTEEEHGGPPQVFETLHIRAKAAPPTNVDFMCAILTKKNVEAVLFRAVEVLSDHENAKQVYETWLDLSRRSAVFERRVKKFTTLMRRDKQEFVTYWSDI